MQSDRNARVLNIPYGIYIYIYKLSFHFAMNIQQSSHECYIKF